MNERSQPSVFENQTTLSLKQFLLDNPVGSPWRLAFDDLINTVESHRNTERKRENLLKKIAGESFAAYNVGIPEGSRLEDPSVIRAESELRIAENIVAQLEVTRLVHQASITGYRESEDDARHMWTKLIASFRQPNEDIYHDSVAAALAAVHDLEERQLF